MGWHDATIWAIAFLQPEPTKTLDSGGELMLDIDYIVQWVDPVPSSEYFTFAVAPATHVFHDVWDVEAGFAAGLQEADAVTIDSLERGEPENDAQRAQHVRPWIMNGSVFGSLVASGFHQYFRSKPIDAGHRQRLTFEQRGGISFARPTSFA